MEQVFSTFGRHVAVDTWGVDFLKLNDVRYLEQQLVQAAQACGATVLSTQSKQFEPQGVTVLVMLSESHLSIHTYPEKGFAAIDCYTCGTSVDPQDAIDYVLTALQPSERYSQTLIRGQGPIEVMAVAPTERVAAEA